TRSAVDEGRAGQREGVLGLVVAPVARRDDEAVPVAVDEVEADASPLLLQPAEAERLPGRHRLRIEGDDLQVLLVEVVRRVRVDELNDVATAAQGVRDPEVLEADLAVLLEVTVRGDDPALDGALALLSHEDDAVLRGLPDDVPFELHRPAELDAAAAGDVVD